MQPGQQQLRCVIPVLQNPSSPGGFPGLYAFSLHDQCFIDDKTLLVTSQWYSMTVILKVDIDSGAVAPVTSTDPTQGSWSLQVWPKRLCLPCGLLGFARPLTVTVVGCEALGIGLPQVS
jgi:hypothetical protein